MKPVLLFLQAVSVASAFSDRLCVKSYGSINVNISIQYIMSCCSECGNQCESGFPDKAWKFIMDYGAVTGGDYGSEEVNDKNIFYY